MPDTNDEVQRLSHYVSWKVLDAAEAQAQRFGFATIQDYCTDLLTRAIDSERIREHVAEVEAKRGTLAGLREIADDPDYLADLSSANIAGARTQSPSAVEYPPAAPYEIQFLEPDPALPGAGLFATFKPQVNPPHALQIPKPAPATKPLKLENLRPESPTLSIAEQVVLRHAGQLGDDPSAFLPCLRRGQSVPPAEVAELAQALYQIEREYHGLHAMGRGLTFALHRLAFESQILHTDAWPGTFDVWTVDMLRAVQEAVERILSGQDIRYYTGTSGPQLDHEPRPESPR